MLEGVDIDTVIRNDTRPLRIGDKNNKKRCLSSKLRAEKRTLSIVDALLTF